MAMDAIDVSSLDSLKKEVISLRSRKKIPCGKLEYSIVIGEMKDGIEEIGKHSRLPRV